MKVRFHARNLVAESQPTMDTPWKEEGSKEKKQNPQAEWKEEKWSPSQLLRGWISVCLQWLLRSTFLSKCNFLLVEFKCKHSHEVILSVALSYFSSTLVRIAGPCGSWILLPWRAFHIFMTCNFITGMFQHLEKLRKNAFASILLSATNNSSSISGSKSFKGERLLFSWA